MKRAFTLLELLVVVLILGLLSTIAVGVYVRQVERARIAAAKSTISAIELAVERYQIDTGDYPPSGSGPLPYTGPATFEGNGYLQAALMTSLSGSSSAPLSPRWQGPYLTVKNEILGDINGYRLDDPNSPATGVQRGELQILDPWQSPYRYVRSRSQVNAADTDQYAFNGGTVLPTAHPFATTETFYNANTFQVVSKGPNGVTGGTNLVGRESDDVTNFGM